MLISKATPLIAVARIGELTLLERIVHHVTLLETVWAEVIVLAEELRAQEVLLDERAARAIAIARGRPVIGTAGLLVRAKDRGFIPAVRLFLSRIQAEDMRYHQRFIETLLGQLGDIGGMVTT